MFDNTCCKSIRLALDQWKVHRSIRNWIVTMLAQCTSNYTCEGRNLHHYGNCFMWTTTRRRFVTILWLLVEWPVWLNSRAFARDPKGREFESRLVRFQVIALGKLLTRMCLCHKQYNLVPADGRCRSSARKVTAGLAESI